MGSQTRIAMGVIGVLMTLFVAILYLRFASSGEIEGEPTKMAPVSSVAEKEAVGGAEPTIVDSQTGQLPQEAFNPSPRPTSIGPQPGRSAPNALLPPEFMLPPEAMLPSDALLTPAEVEARHRPQWPVPSPLDERRFQLQPSRLR